MTELHDGELLPATTSEVAEYTQTAAALAELRQQLAGKVFDCTIPAQDKEARQSRLVLVRLRTSLDAKRLELNADDQARIRKRNDEARRIIGEIVALETPIDDQIRAEEVRKQAIKDAAEQAERARVAANETALRAIQQAPLAYLNLPADQVEAELERMTAYDTTTVDADFRDRLDVALRTALQQLTDMLESRRQLEAQRAENEARERQLAEERLAQRLRDERLQTIRDYPARFRNASDGELAVAFCTAERSADTVEEQLDVHPDDIEITRELWRRAVTQLQEIMDARKEAAELAAQREEQAKMAREQQAERDRLQAIADAQETERRVIESDKALVAERDAIRAKVADTIGQDALDMLPLTATEHRARLSALRFALVAIQADEFDAVWPDLLRFGVVSEVTVDTLDGSTIQRVLAAQESQA